MDAPQWKHLVTGAVLIVLGLGVFALQSAQGFGEAVPLMVIGGLFMAGYLYQGAYGLLIPGCLLLGLGLGTIGKGVMPGAVDFDAIGLGVGFVGIYVVALACASRSHWWPLIPGLVLIIVGLSSGHTGFERILAKGWPLILVCIGLVLLLKTVGIKGR